LVRRICASTVFHINQQPAVLNVALHELDDSLVWGDGWTLGDLVAHLAEWQQMFLRWYADGLRGVEPAMPAPGFKWNETPRLNRAIREKHRSRPLATVRAEFDAGYGEIIRVVEGLPPRALLQPGRFEWTGKHALSTYLGPNTASHYRFAIKVIDRWLRRDRNDGSRARRMLPGA
jgi:hypothetical protein